MNVKNVKDVSIKPLQGISCHYVNHSVYWYYAVHSQHRHFHDVQMVILIDYVTSCLWNYLRRQTVCQVLLNEHVWTSQVIFLLIQIVDLY